MQQQQKANNVKRPCAGNKETIGALFPRTTRPLCFATILSFIEQGSDGLIKKQDTITSNILNELQRLAPPRRPTYRVVCLGRHGAHRVRVPDDQVCVGAHGDPALARVQVQDLGCVGAGHRHKHVLVHLARGLTQNGDERRTVFR